VRPAVAAGVEAGVAVEIVECRAGKFEWSGSEAGSVVVYHLAVGSAAVCRLVAGSAEVCRLVVGVSEDLVIELLVASVGLFGRPDAM